MLVGQGAGLPDMHECIAIASLPKRIITKTSRALQGRKLKLPPGNDKSPTNALPPLFAETPARLTGVDGSHAGALLPSNTDVHLSSQTKVQI